MSWESLDAEDAAWVDANRMLVERAFLKFSNSDTWPTIADLQRDFDRDDHDVNVAAALQSLPKIPGQPAPVGRLTNVFIPLRLLRFVPQLGDLLGICVAIVQRAYQIYRSDSSTPHINSDDADLLRAANNDPRFLNLAARLLGDSSPNVYEGGSRWDAGWRYGISPSIRELRDTKTIEDYVRWQIDVLSQQINVYRELGPEPQAPGQPTAFVMMPFGQPWSAGVYNMIRRAVTANTVDADIRIVRADEMLDLGLITDHIKAAIQSATVLIADITDLNPNVMYELGYADAFDKPVVILNQDVDKAPFDVRNIRQVQYSSPPTRSEEGMITRQIEGALRQAIV
jgi:hypothetical protein